MAIGYFNLYSDEAVDFVRRLDGERKYCDEDVIPIVQSKHPSQNPPREVFDRLDVAERKAKEVASASGREREG